MVCDVIFVILEVCLQLEVLGGSMFLLECVIYVFDETGPYR